MFASINMYTNNGMTRNMTINATRQSNHVNTQKQTKKRDLYIYHHAKEYKLHAYHLWLIMHQSKNHTTCITNHNLPLTKDKVTKKTNQSHDLVWGGEGGENIQQ